MPERIESSKDLVVWQQALESAVDVYEATRNWPREELYGSTSQARRAATSVPASIAEGYGRENVGSYQQFLRIAKGSLKELETHPPIAGRLGFLSNDAIASLMSQSESVGKLMRLLIRKPQTP